MDVPDGSSRHVAELAAAPPYDFALSLRAMGGFMPTGSDHRLEGERVRKGFALSGSDEAVVVDVGAVPDGVRVEVFAAGDLTPEEARAVEVTVSRWLSLDDDPGPFLALADADPAMADVLELTRGLHQVRFPTLAEGAAYFVLTQRTSQLVAASRKRALAEAHGPRLRVDGAEYVAFPSLEALAAMPPDELARFAATKQQADYLTHVPAGLAALDDEWLHTAPDDEVLAALRAIRGVGEFTAAAIALRILGRSVGVPMQMRQFADAAREMYGPGGVEEVQKRYGAQVGLWSYHTRTAFAWLNRPFTHSTARSR